MNNYQNSAAAKDIFKGAVIGAAIATAVAVLMNKDTREKISKSVKDAMKEMKKHADEMKKDTREKYEREIKQREEPLRQE